MITDNLVLPFTGHLTSQNSLVFEKGEGVFLYDIDGKKYLDGHSSIRVAALGHNHPHIVKNMKSQMDKLVHTSLFGHAHTAALELVSALLDFTKLPNHRALFLNSGSEAVESALKIAVNYFIRKEGTNTKRRRILTFQDTYHGETVGAMSVSGASFHRTDPWADYSALMKDQIEAASPVMTYKQRVALSAPPSENWKTLLEENKESVAAVIIEPVYGSGGVLFPSDSFLKEVATACREIGALLIVDEIITGFYRTGCKFCFHQLGIEPDILVLGKALTAGHAPLSAALFSKKIFEHFDRKPGNSPFLHGHTFSGFPLGCIAAKSAIEVYKSPEFEAHMREIVPYFNERAASLKHKHIAEIRHRGMYAGIELYSENEGKDYRQICRDVCATCQDNGLILKNIGNIIVLTPPLICNREEVDFLFDRLDLSIRKVLN